MTEPDNKIVPFGKYKGQPIEALAADKQYADWLAAQPWFREKFQPIYNIIVNNFGEPSETPEHNAMQALFLQDEYVLALGIASGAFKSGAHTVISKVGRLKQRLRSRIEDTRRSIESTAKRPTEQKVQAGFEAYFAKREAEEREEIERMRKHLASNEALEKELNAVWGESGWVEVAQARARFEVDAIDVVASIEIRPRLPENVLADWSLVGREYVPPIGQFSAHENVFAELKPSLGDEYPAVLRQMERGQTGVLVVGEFRAQGASLDQVTDLFARSRKQVIMLAEVRGLLGMAKEIVKNGSRLEWA